MGTVLSSSVRDDVTILSSVSFDVGLQHASQRGFFVKEIEDHPHVRRRGGLTMRQFPDGRPIRPVGQSGGLGEGNQKRRCTKTGPPVQSLWTTPRESMDDPPRRTTLLLYRLAAPGATRRGSQQVHPLTVYKFMNMVIAQVKML